jgi:arylformamidase
MLNATESKDLFRTRDHVADFDRYVQDYESRSIVARQIHRTTLNLRYGPRADEILDLFMPASTGGAPLPVHLFIHGGYWRMFSKDDFSFVADPVVAAGGVTAVMDYSLMPGVRMEFIVDQVRRAAQWLVANAHRFNGDPNRLTVSGHSAGAHLACMLLDEDSPVAPQGALLLSGIYDLMPLQSSFLQPLIGLTEEEVERFSPVQKSFRAGSQALLVVGEGETAPFHTQADAMERRLAEDGLRTQRIDVAGANHMSVALELGTPESPVGRLLGQLVRGQAG